MLLLQQDRLRRQGVAMAPRVTLIWWNCSKMRVLRWQSGDTHFTAFPPPLPTCPPRSPPSLDSKKASLHSWGRNGEEGGGGFLSPSSFFFLVGVYFYIYLYIYSIPCIQFAFIANEFCKIALYRVYIKQIIYKLIKMY